MLRPILALLALVLTHAAADAAEFTIDKWRGKTVLRMSGPIFRGDAGQFARLASRVPPAPHGLPIMLLESPGGSVDEALAISKLLEKTPFHTVVPDRARCASACASVVFIAGTYRTVEPFGLLGQHSCSVGGQADQECNEELAAHAVTKGVSHGSIAAFVTYTPPDDILWFTMEDSDGWGLTRYPGEAESGFEKSEPRVLKNIFGRMPPAQSAWRIDFLGDGYRAFVRPGADNERELQLDVHCLEAYPGRLFVTMEINGPRQVVADAALGVTAGTELFEWHTDAPVIEQLDPQVTAVTVVIPEKRVKAFLREANEFKIRLAMRPPYETIGADTYLTASRRNLVFAANHCSTGRWPPSR